MAKSKKPEPKKAKKPVKPKVEKKPAVEKKSEPSFLSLSQFAKLVGVHPTTLQRTVETGVFSEASCTVNRTEKSVSYQFHPELAFKEFETYKGRRKSRNVELETNKDILDGEDDMNTTEGDQRIDKEVQAFDIYRAYEMKYRAKKAKLEYQNFAGQYTEVTEVKQAAMKIAKAIKDAFQKLPGKVIGKIIEAKNNVHAIEQLLLNEVNTTLESIDWQYVQKVHLGIRVDDEPDDNNDDSDTREINEAESDG